jgi:hypothetical protein
MSPTVHQVTGFPRNLDDEFIASSKQAQLAAISRNSGRAQQIPSLHWYSFIRYQPDGLFESFIRMAITCLYFPIQALVLLLPARAPIGPFVLHHQPGDVALAKP